MEKIKQANSILELATQQLLEAIQGLKTEEDILTKRLQDLNELKGQKQLKKMETLKQMMMIESRSTPVEKSLQPSVLH